MYAFFLVCMLYKSQFDSLMFRGNVNDLMLSCVSEIEVDKYEMACARTTDVLHERTWNVLEMSEAIETETEVLIMTGVGWSLIEATENEERIGTGNKEIEAVRRITVNRTGTMVVIVTQETGVKILRYIE